MVGRTSPPLWDPGLTWPLLGLKSGEPWFPLLVMAFSSEPGAIPESQQRTGRGQAGTGSKSTAALVWKRWVRTWWSSDVSIIIRNSSHQAVFVLNCHLPHQDCPCPPSLFADSLRIWGILMPQDGVQISVSLLGTTFFKLSLKTGIFHYKPFGSIFPYILVLSQNTWPFYM